MSYATVTASKMDIGPCQVFFDGDDLGGTLDNVVVNFKYEKAPLKADQHGSALLDEAISGIEVTIETSWAEVRNKTLLAALFPDADHTVDSPKDKLVFADKVAARALPGAKALKLHPLVEGDSSLNFDWVFFKARPSEESSYTFGPAEQGKLKIVWKVYLDESTTPKRLFLIGDPTAT